MRLPHLFRRHVRPPLQFSDDKEMRRIGPLADEFLGHILFDEEPLFISDEATIWDVSMAPDATELSERCLQFYGVLVSADDFKQPLWSLIEYLDRSRKIKGSN